MHQQYDDSPDAEAGRAGAAQPPAAPAVSGPSNTDTANSRILRFGLDSLYLSFPGQLSDTWAEILEQKRTQAQAREANTQAKAQVSVLDHQFEVGAHGRGLFRYVLQDNAYRIELAGPSALKIPVAACKISSEWLTQLGVEQAVDQLRNILTAFASLTDSISVSRADLFVDFLYPLGIHSWTQESWVSRADLIEQYHDKGRFSGWAVGKGGLISARFYDKTIHIEKSGQDYLKALWHERGWEPGQQVYRLELQLRHGPLVSLGAGHYPALMERIGAIWRYCLEDWLRLTIPNPEDDTRSRWPTHALWSALTNVAWKDQVKGERIPPNKNRVPSDEYLYRYYTSVLSSYMAAKKIHSPEDAMESLFVQARGYFDSRAFISGTGFDELVKDRARLKAVKYNLPTQSPEDELSEARREYLRQTGKGS